MDYVVQLLAYISFRECLIHIVALRFVAFTCSLFWGVNLMFKISQVAPCFQQILPKFQVRLNLLFHSEISDIY